MLIFPYFFTFPVLLAGLSTLGTIPVLILHFCEKKQKQEYYWWVWFALLAIAFCFGAISVKLPFLKVLLWVFPIMFLYQSLFKDPPSVVRNLAITMLRLLWCSCILVIYYLICMSMLWLDDPNLKVVSDGSLMILGVLSLWYFIRNRHLPPLQLLRYTGFVLLLIGLGWQIW